MSKKYFSAAVVLTFVFLAVWIVTSRNDNHITRQDTAQHLQGPSEHQQLPEPAQSNSSQSNEDLPTAISQASIDGYPDVDGVDPLALYEWGIAHGYYLTDLNDDGAQHPYVGYDIQTLSALAENGDGLAKLILADRISHREPNRADVLYLEAAALGKTAALTNLAASHLLILPGSDGFGIPFTDESGNVSEQYAEVLRYYAAAEMMGDFVASELLRGALEVHRLLDSEASINIVCQMGKAIREALLHERDTKWGEVSLPPTSLDMKSKYTPICQ